MDWKRTLRFSAVPAWLAMKVHVCPDIGGDLVEIFVSVVGGSRLLKTVEYWAPAAERLTARKIDPRCLEPGDVLTNVSGARQTIAVKQGIERDLAKKIQGLIKDSKLKVDSQINGEKLRVTGKKRDDLQSAMQLLRGQELERPLQFDNFRD